MEKKYVVITGLVVIMIVSIGLYQAELKALNVLQRENPTTTEPDRRPINRPGTPKSTTECAWRFDRYEPSEFELKWKKNYPQWDSDVCNKIRDDEKDLRSIIERVIDLTFIDGNITWNGAEAPLSSRDEVDKLFSLMHYVEECWNVDNPADSSVVQRGVQMIEPLFGILRDPFDIYCGALALPSFPKWVNTVARGQSTQHILGFGYAPFFYSEQLPLDLDKKGWRKYGVAPWQLSKKAGSQNVLLDLGSSYFAGWTNVANAASGRYFYNRYHERGTKFTRFISVEAEKLDATKYWGQIPADIVPHHTFINAFLTCGDNGTLDSLHILRSVKKEDFFIFKLDIDSAPIEAPIAKQILEDDDISDRIDEFMFEHHVDVAPMRGSWGGNLKEKMIDSYNLFTRIREKGVRSHSWP